MPKRLIYNTFQFEYDTYNELINDIPDLKETFNIGYGIQQENGTWELEVMRYDDLLIDKSILYDTYIIYNKDMKPIHQGTNNLDERFKNDINKMDKSDKKKYCLLLEHDIGDRDRRLLKILDEKEIFDLIDIALDRGDFDRVKKLREYININKNNY